jgi:hypothetical protein
MAINQNTIYDQLNNRLVALEYVRGQIQIPDLEDWERKEYCALELDNIAAIADLQIAIANYEEKYGARL